MKKLDKTNTIRLVAVIVFLLFSALLTVLFIPIIKNLATEEGRMIIKDKVENFGIFAPLMIMLMQAIQVIIAFIPGEPVEILSGLLFGTFWGLLFSVLGILAGSILVYFMVKSFGKPIVNAFVSEEKMHKFKVLDDEKKLELLVFILFLVPGTPKDALAYVVPLTKINPMKYFILSTLARLPSIVTSAFMGASIGDGNIMMTVIIFLITGAIGIVGILLKNRKKDS